MSKLPKVYIIILNWNGLSDTLNCLRSLRNINYQNFETIVIDNGSKIGEGQIIKQKFPAIHLIINKQNLGFAEGNNIGIKYALSKRAPYILLLNNDTYVSANFLDILIDYAQKHNKAGVLGPKILYFDRRRIWFNGVKLYGWLGLFRHREFNLDDKKSKIKTVRLTDYVSGCALLIKREVLKKIGFFYPPFFAYYEEADLCFRARKAGYQSVVVPQSIIWHKVGTNIFTKLQAYYFPRNALLFAKRNLRGLNKYLFLIAQYSSALIYNLLRCEDSQARLVYIKSLLKSTFHE